MNKQVNFSKLLKNKETFLLSTYSLLVIELVISMAIVYAMRDSPMFNKITRQSILIYFALTFGLILILSFVPMPSWLKICVFTIFAVVMGGFLHSTSILIPREVIDNALFGTISVFVIMTCFAFILAALGVDLSFMMIIMLAAIIGLLIASIIVYFFAKKSNKVHKIMLIVGLIIFSIYVIVYTNVILQPKYNFNYVDAAIDLYVSFISIFTRILALESE